MFNFQEICLPLSLLLSTACPHNYIWHSIEIEEDEWPNVVDSLMLCWAIYNLTCILSPLGTQFYTAEIDHTADSLVGIWPLRTVCSWGDAGRYKAPATTFAGSETFGYLSHLSGGEAVPASGHVHRRGLLDKHFLGLPPSPASSLWGHNLLCSSVGLGEKMEMQFLGAQLGSRCAKLLL